MEQGKVMNEELKRNIRDKWVMKMTVVVKDDEPSVTRSLGNHGQMSSEELQANKDKLARMEREDGRRRRGQRRRIIH